MFDKVRLRIKAKKPWHSSTLRERGFTSPFDSRGKRWYQNVKVNPGCVLKLDWFSTCREHYLSAEVSLPKLLYGHNVAQLCETDIVPVLDRVSDLVSDRAGVDFDASRADVAEVEVCHNWKLTHSEVYARIQSLQGGYYPRTTRHAISDSTVNFKNKSEEICLYSKHAQMAQLMPPCTDEVLIASVGVLRYEHTFFDTGRLADHLHLADRSAQSLLTCDFALTTLNDDMEKLGLNKPIHSSGNRLNLVAEKFGLFSSEHERAAKFLKLGEQYGFENLVALGMSSRSFDRYKKILRDAGAGLTTNEKRIYPPLRIVGTSNMLSNTTNEASRMAETA